MTINGYARLQGSASRIVLRAMTEKTISIACSLLLWAAMLQPVLGQVDTTAIGGPEDSSSYEEAGSGLVMDDLHEEAMEWSAADSAFFIPAYDTYGDWNTDQIFGRRSSVTDTVDLRLAWAACDHAMPILGHVTSPFGMRHGRHHYGTDIKLQTGDTVMSAFAGKVRISRYHRDFGHVVVVRHPNGLETLYGHLSKRLVDVGDDVEAGDVLGLGGSTGRSTGSHLHFETRYLGHPINPEQIFDLAAGTLHCDTYSVTPRSFQIPAGNRAGHYRVRKGDTLYAISRRTGIAVNRLCKINRISASSTLRVGQTLRLQ